MVILNVGLFCLLLYLVRRKSQMWHQPQGVLICCRSPRNYSRKLRESDTNSWPATALEHLRLHPPPLRLLLNPPSIPPSERDSDSNYPSGATDVTSALILKCFIMNLSALSSYCIRLDKSRSTLFQPAGKFIFSTRTAAAMRMWQKVIKHPNTA